MFYAVVDHVLVEGDAADVAMALEAVGWKDAEHVALKYLASSVSSAMHSLMETSRSTC